MKALPQTTPDDRPKHGSALIITLLVLVLLVVLVTGFLTTARVEQMASRNFTYQNVARQMAMTGVQQALAQLNEATKNLTNTNTYRYISRPGSIIVDDKTNELSSWDVFGVGNLNPQYANLNVGQVIQTNKDTNIYYNFPLIAVTNSSGGTTKTNGRYAYWIDDEGSKANLNAMSNAPRSSFFPNQPRSYDYSAISTNGSNNFDLAIKGNFSNSWPYFFTGNQIGLLDTNMSNVDVVNLRHSMGAGPGNQTTNSFRFLSDRQINVNSGSGGANFIKNPASPNSELSTIVNNINHLANSNIFGGSFTTKYGDALQQLVVNINDWPLSGITNTSLFTGDNGDGITIPTKVFGLRRAPYLNEIAVGVVMSTNSPSTTAEIQVWVQAEMVNPYSSAFGKGWAIKQKIESLKFEGTYMDTNGTNIPFKNDPVSETWNFDGSPINISNWVTLSDDVPAKGYLKVSDAFVFEWQLGGTHGTVPNLPNNASNIVIDKAEIQMASVVAYSSLGRRPPFPIRDWAVRTDFPVFKITGPVLTNSHAFGYNGTTSTNPPAVVVFNNGIAKNDPRVKTFTGWAPLSTTNAKAWLEVGGSSGKSVTLGTVNSVVNFSDRTNTTGRLNVGTDDPQQAITSTADMFKPPFFVENTNGSYRTVMELSHVHTGLQWRTLQLYRHVSTDPPEAFPMDWALLQTFYMSNSQPRVNVNSVQWLRKLSSATLDTPASMGSRGIWRVNSLQSLLSGANMSNATALGFAPPTAMLLPGDPVSPPWTATNSTISNVARTMALVTNIADSYWMTSTLAGTKRVLDALSNAYYTSVGEVLELRPVTFYWSGNGAINNRTIGENRASGFIDAMSVNSDSFMIYSYGDAVDAAGNITAEYRCKAFVKYNYTSQKFEVLLVEPMPLP